MLPEVPAGNFKDTQSCWNEDNRSESAVQVETKHAAMLLGTSTPQYRQSL